MDPYINCPLNPRVREPLPNQLQLSWPPQGIQNQERDLIADFIKVSYPYVLAHPQAATTFRKKRVHLIENAAWHLPITLTFFMDSSHIVGIVLLLNKARGEVLTGGAQRAPKTSHDLLRGKVVKKTATPNEEPIVDYIMKNPQRGLVEIFDKRSVRDAKTHVVKVQYFERYCNGPLSKWIGNKFLNRPLFKLYLINSLLKGLQRLQTLQPAANQPLKGNFTSFHGDLKPANLLLSNSGIHITDFGASNLRHKLCFTPLYAHPIYWTLTRKSDEEWVVFLEENGARLDLWAAGIVCAIILCNRFSSKIKGDTPPLSFIEKHVRCFSRFETLTQEEVDQEILYKKSEIGDGPEAVLLAALWDLVQGFLRVDLNYPRSLNQAFDYTAQLIETHSPALKATLDREDQLQTLARLNLNSPVS